MSYLSQFTLAIASVGACSPLCAQTPGAPLSASPSGIDNPAETQEPATRPAPKLKGLQWQVDDFTVKFGGYIKVDLIHDFDEIGSTDSFDPRTIPVNDESNPGVNTRMHARSTRLNLDVRGPTSAGDIRMFVEGDFFGDGNAFRLRHAYGTLGPVLGGQTWSTFMDEDTMPETLDFESPIAFPLIRQAQIRLSQDIGDGGSYWAVALEDPASNLVPPNVPGEIEEASPDLTARLRWVHGLGHCQLGLFAGTARYDPTIGPADTVFLWGINASTKLKVYKSDLVFVQATYGDGVGRYRGGITAAPDLSGNLEAVTVLAGMLGYEHHWCDKWRSTVTYSLGEGDVPAGAPTTTPETLSYFAANLIWQFSDRAWAGVEYLYGAREDVSDARGEANRVQFSVRFNF